MAFPVPHINLLCIDPAATAAFVQAREKHSLPSSITFTLHDHALAQLPASTKFDCIVSPANSYGILDGGFDDAISRAFSPRNNYLALTRVAQQKIYEEKKGFMPPGSCTLVIIPEDFVTGEGDSRSRNVWGTKHLALLPTMRVPSAVGWDREVVYECIWSLLNAIYNHNRSAASEEDKIASLLMTPLATGAGFVSNERWANQTVLALKHFVNAVGDPERWGAMKWPEAYRDSWAVGSTWKKPGIAHGVSSEDTGLEKTGI